MGRYTLTEYCVLHNRPELLKEWDQEKNGELAPDAAHPHSRVRVYWRCEKGHSWITSIRCRVEGLSGCPVCAGKAVQSGENDLATLYPEIAAQWHPTKNGQLLPSMVRPGTHRKVWWLCDRGHEWQAEVKSRVAGNGCPYCTGRMVIPGETDLATLYPKLAVEWHPTKNGSLTPQDVRPGTAKKVWWRCEHGHEWQAAIASRVRGNGCPICGSKTVVAGINDFASQYPNLAKQWHPEKNGALKPDMVTAQSNRVVWWRDELGHEWRAQIASRIRGDGCPICGNKKLLTGFNDLQTRYPEIAKEWDSEKNGTTPDKVLPTKRKVWWRCPNGHEYQCQIDTRAYQKCGCPVCAGRSVVAGENDLATLYPRLAKQWHPTKNGTLKPTMVTAASNKKVWWRCELGHEWKAMVVSRSLKGTGCPVCAGKIVLVGFNDLASQEPKIAAQWHPTLNAPRTPEMFACGSNQKIWWQCGEGHVWQAPIGRRYYQRSGCPVCAGNVGKKRLAKYERMMKEVLAEQERKRRLEE